MGSGPDRTRAGAEADAGAVRVRASVREVDATAWDGLLAAAPEPTPFMRHAWLAALEASGSATADTGWQPLVLTLSRGGALQAACALYAKSHSYGEYVFDWAWARAFERAGQPYYPKLLAAVPFTPVPGSRLLAADARDRAALLAAIETLAAQQGWSSAHLLLGDAADRAAVTARGWALREGLQFHWHNRAPAPWCDFDDFLASLTRDKRKKIQQERRQVRDAGVGFRVCEGQAITPADWAFFHRCYVQTYHEHGNPPYLTADFFARLARDLPEACLLFIAERAGMPVAASLVMIERAGGVAWGRYWGAVEPVRALHFEACYYQPLQWCIAQGFRRFEGGAQGEHKMARGLLPAPTWSAHWIADARWRPAIARFAADEGEQVGSWRAELAARNPFKEPTAAAGDATPQAPFSAGPGATSPPDP